MDYEVAFITLPPATKYGESPTYAVPYAIMVEVVAELKARGAEQWEKVKMCNKIKCLFRRAGRKDYPWDKVELEWATIDCETVTIRCTDGEMRQLQTSKTRSS
jgi:hypothetical protein